jgi:hypothetical protein
MLSGCLSDSTGNQAPPVYVFNNGDRTMSVIDDDELVEDAWIQSDDSIGALVMA